MQNGAFSFVSLPRFIYWYIALLRPYFSDSLCDELSPLLRIFLPSFFDPPPAFLVNPEVWDTTVCQLVLVTCQGVSESRSLERIVL
jgi:hypothetical protein